MEPIIIEGTPKTPTVKFDSSEGVFEIKGRSIPENPAAFFEPILSWLTEYFEQNPKNAKIEFKLDYINSGSSKSIMGILKLLNQLYREYKNNL